jgi:hypothetical protein
MADIWIRSFQMGQRLIIDQTTTGIPGRNRVGSFSLENTLSLSTQPVFLSRAIANIFDSHLLLWECSICSRLWNLGNFACEPI